MAALHDSIGQSAAHAKMLFVASHGKYSIRPIILVLTAAMRWELLLLVRFVTLFGCVYGSAALARILFPQCRTRLDLLT